MTLLTVFKTLIAPLFGSGRHRRSALSDGGTGTASSCEPLIIGFFVNTLVMRYRPVLAILNVHSRALRAAFASVALDRPLAPPAICRSRSSWRTLHPRRDLSRNPLFQVTFSDLLRGRATAAVGRLSTSYRARPPPPSRWTTDTA